MIDYDSFSLCHLRDIFRYFRGSERVNACTSSSFRGVKTDRQNCALYIRLNKAQYSKMKSHVIIQLSTKFDSQSTQVKQKQFIIIIRLLSLDIINVFIFLAFYILTDQFTSCYILILVFSFNQVSR